MVKVEVMVVEVEEVLVLEEAVVKPILDQWYLFNNELGKLILTFYKK